MGLRYVASIVGGLLLFANSQSVQANPVYSNTSTVGRERINIDTEWRFWRTTTNPDGLIYDKRPDFSQSLNDTATILKPWVLPSANEYISDPADRYERPAGNPAGNVSYVQSHFDDSAWEAVNLPHDWAIAGPFQPGNNATVQGGMGRLPVNGVGWYRRKLTIASEDQGKSIYLDVDGAMSYAIVWLNGNLVGGWPYGYNSFRLDLTPYVKLGEDNQLAIRLDNPNDSSRWYPGGGIYRSVWVTKVNPVHVAHYGTHITTDDVSTDSATVNLVVQVENSANSSQQIEVATDVHIFDATTGKAAAKVAEFSRQTVSVSGGDKQSTNYSVTIQDPELWGPKPSQNPNLYVALTRLYANSTLIDTYETRFGLRSLTFDANQGLLVNGELIKVRGVNNHHDLGALGAAFNVRAAERQLEILQDMGGNAVRMSHNPPAPELLDLADQMGFLVLEEIFDCWYALKTSNDFHLIFPDWHEPDLRNFIRRDRNHPSIIAWSYGNEVGEQYTAEAGAAVSQMLHDIVREEDPTRLSTASMNYAKPNMSFPQVLDVISLNYQGEGIRDTSAYANTGNGIRTPPLYSSFHSTFPEKLIWSTETASALSTRGTYIFPVVNATSAPVNDTSGGDPVNEFVSAYELYSANFGSSADKVFAAQDNNPYVAGEYVWSGFDYIGEPTPYYGARSSYSGIIDLAGFKKDRYYLYQSRWRPDVQFAHILPHWNWPDRVGQVTPVHVFSSADEAELFLNGESQGRLQKADYTYRFRWDEVVYQPGELQVLTYKNGSAWANATVQTTGEPAQLKLTADRNAIKADGYDLSYITVEVLDSKGEWIRSANTTITFSTSGPGEIVATDNGDPADFVAFPSKQRNAFSGLALGIVRGTAGSSGSITVTASADGLEDGTLTVALQ